jgi:hypothetical protein
MTSLIGELAERKGNDRSINEVDKYLVVGSSAGEGRRKGNYRKRDVLAYSMGDTSWKGKRKRNVSGGDRAGK